MSSYVGRPSGLDDVPRIWNCQAIKQFEASNSKIPVNLRIEDAFNSARVGSFADVIRFGGDLLNHHYEKATRVAASAVNDIKNLWISTDGTSFHRAKVVNKLIAYYLISLAIYIIEICFWTNGKMIQGVASLVLDSRDNTRILIGLCIAAIFIFVVYLLGAEGPSSSSKICSD